MEFFEELPVKKAADEEDTVHPGISDDGGKFAVHFFGAVALGDQAVVAVFQAVRDAVADGVGKLAGFQVEFIGVHVPALDGGDDPQAFGLAGPQSPGIVVANIAQGVDGFFHPQPGLFLNVGAVVQNSGDGGLGNTGIIGDIDNRNHSIYLLQLL